MSVLRNIIRRGRIVAVNIASAIMQEVYYSLNRYAVARFILQLRNRSQDDIKPLKNYINSLKTKVMKMENRAYLEDTLKYRGFEPLANEMRANLDKGLDEFKIGTQMEHGKDKVDYQLHFRKGTDANYRLTKFDAVLKAADGNERKQTFYNSNNKSFTAKEAYNLLSGRAVNKNLVNKEGEKYNAWVQLDFSQTNASGNFAEQKYNEKWGFRLEEQLNKLPVQGLGNSDERAKLVASLNKGNSHMVYIEQDGNKQQVFLQANPEKRSINVYDKDMQPVQVVSQKEKYAASKKEEMQQDQSPGKDKSKDNKQAQDNKVKPEKSRGKRMSA